MGKVDLNRKLTGYLGETLKIYDKETDTKKNDLRGFLVYALINSRSDNADIAVKKHFLLEKLKGDEVVLTTEDVQFLKELIPAIFIQTDVVIAIFAQIAPNDLGITEKQPLASAAKTKVD